MRDVDQKSRGTIEIYIGDPKGHLLQALRNAMLHEGFRATADFGRIEEVVEALKHQCPDVLVLDTGLEDGDVCDLIKKIRNNEIGDNPFVPVIVTTWQPDSNLVRRVASCGTDAMLIKPISPGQLFERMEALAFRRRPFVVTSDYTGPDRRNDTNRGSEIPQIQVPNSLRAKAKGSPMSPGELQREIDGTLTTINEEKLSRHAFQISFLEQVIASSMNGNRIDDSKRDMVNHLVYVANDLAQRVVGTQFDHVAELCHSLIEVVTSIQKHFPRPNPKDLQLLKQLSGAILLGFNPDKDSSALSSDIANSMKAYESKQTRSANTA
jgi:DNA-binding response OmpR family regulator